MTSLPAVPHSLPLLARLARSRRAPSSPPPGPLAASLPCSQLSPAPSPPARTLAVVAGGSYSPPPGQPGPPGPKPCALGARCPKAAGRTHGALEAPTGRLRGDPGQWPRGRGGGELVTPTSAAETPPPAPAHQPASKLPAPFSAPAPRGCSARSPCQAVSLLSPPPLAAPLPLQPVGGTGTS